ncbi:GTPase HflX [Hydrogenivirga sp. 128-5-R1-1]|uniref:GTPase HflX n=1 Tax=Hydrogenivirga sp. 128-5-R1-1 TaxID=392423 RepID=UPI00015F17AB|nr:GTPase HflX [Hydrogenivirga sp. 128-5-R1-1]EDP76163.1 GTP-binding protein HflX [Hydrogenivirga sp. 128-5-R1-1]
MRAVLVGIWNRDTTKEEAKESLKELKRLVEAVGGKSIGYVLQNRNRPDVRYFIGEGKARELREVLKGTGADTVVFDDSLTPSQVRNLEKLTGRKVLDRTDLVIEIFSRRAKSKEAKLQVELARLTHELPRLQGRGKSMSRLGGGVGTRGPGEQETEIRRRLIKKRIYQVREELEEVKKMRRHQRKRRERSDSGESILKVALVGYTNAGKSTLLRVLTGRESFSADMLFATLDTKTSSRFLSSDLKVLFTDTVGFIKKLPTELIESFKATLEEVTEADLILHVVDVSDDRWLDYIHTVRDILKELSADGKPVIYVLNKADRIVDSEEEMRHLPHGAFVEGASVVVSAERRWGIDELINKIRLFGERMLAVGSGAEGSTQT